MIIRDRNKPYQIIAPLWGFLRFLSFSRKKSFSGEIMARWVTAPSVHRPLFLRGCGRQLLSTEQLLPLILL